MSNIGKSSKNIHFYLFKNFDSDSKDNINKFGGQLSLHDFNFLI